MDMNKEKILNVIKKSKNISLYEIAEKTGLSYPTVLKHISILETEKKIKVKKIGRIRLINWQ